MARFNYYQPFDAVRRYYRSAPPLMNLLPPSSSSFSVAENTIIFDDVAVQERFHHHHHHHHQHQHQRHNHVPVSSYFEEGVMIFDGDQDAVPERLFERSRPTTTNHHRHSDQQRTTRNNTGCLSEEEISKCVELKSIVTSHDDDDEGICVICQENLYFRDDDDDEEEGGGEKKVIIGVISSCGHEFHFDCVAKWLQLKNVCPLCKAKPYYTL